MNGTGAIPGNRLRTITLPTSEVWIKGARVSMDFYIGIGGVVIQSDCLMNYRIRWL